MYDPLYEFGDIESISGNEGIVGCFTSEEGERMVLVTTLTPTKGTKIAMEVKSNVSSVKKTINNMTEEINVYEDRKSTRLNSSHVAISYAVFCLKKKTFR